MESPDEKYCTICKDPKVWVYRAKKCRHCYDLCLAVSKIQKTLDRIPKSEKWRHDEGSLRLKVAQSKVESAKNDGDRFSHLENHSIDGLYVEFQLRRISKWFLKKELYVNYATIFDDHFTPAQRKLLYHLLSQMERIYGRRNREKIAWMQYHEEEVQKLQKK